MRLKLKSKEADRLHGDGLSAKFTDDDQKNDFLLLSIRALLQFIKDFSLDLKEIKSDEFKNDVDQLSDNFAYQKKLGKIQTRFVRDKKIIGAYIERYKKYLIDREGELKDIIDILTGAMATLDSENQLYNQKILQQSEKIEQITFLDDIKKVKQALVQEIEQMRETVKEKQSRDSVKLDSLAKQVDTLNQQLHKARIESETDGLTGIYNRKTFDHRIAALVSPIRCHVLHFPC